MSNDFPGEELLLEIVGRLNSVERRLDDTFEPEKGWTPVFLTTPLTSTSWDGDGYSTVGTSTQIDLSSVFGTPANIKAVLMSTQVRDTSGGAGDYWFSCGPSSTYYYAQTVYSLSTTVYSTGRPALIPCDGNGDLWYRINASGSGTLRVYLRIWGYWK